MNQFENLLEMLQFSVDKHEMRTALAEPVQLPNASTWSYGALWEDVAKVGIQLAKLGMKQGEHIGLLADTQARWTISDFSIMSVGACTVPIYPSLPSGQVQHIVEHSEMKGIIVENEKQLKKLIQASDEGTNQVEFVILFADDISSELLAGAKERWSMYSFSEWLAGAATEAELAKWDSEWRRLRRTDKATIVYTSGTTGLPKGVVLTHGNLLANVEGIRDNVPIHEDDISLSYLPLSHIFERTAGQMILLDAGGCIGYSRGFAYVAEDFLVQKPTVLTTVPRLLEKVHEGVQEQIRGSAVKQWLFKRALAAGVRARVHHKRAFGLNLYDRLVFSRIREAMGGNIRLIVVGGAPMPPYIGEFFLAAGLTVIEGYGMTETSPVISANVPEAPRVGSAGRVLNNVQVLIAEDGEILVKGPSVTQGYYKNEEATMQTFTDDGWLRTGDIGELGDDRYLKITDRKKHLLVLSTGKKVTPAPIEGEILKSPYIDQVMLVGQGRKYVTAILALNHTLVEDHLKSQGIDRHLQERNYHQSARKLGLSEVQKYASPFAKFEQPKKVLVAKEPFTIENGLLTPTLKTKPKQILLHYANEIAALYEEQEWNADHTDFDPDANRSDSAVKG